MTSRLPLLGLLLLGFVLGISGVGFNLELVGWLLVATGVYHFVLAVLVGRGVQLSERLFAYTPGGQVLMGVSSMLFGAALLWPDVLPQDQGFPWGLAVVMPFGIGVRMELQAKERRQSGQ